MDFNPLIQNSNFCLVIFFFLLRNNFGRNNFGLVTGYRFGMYTPLPITQH